MKKFTVLMLIAVLASASGCVIRARPVVVEPAPPGAVMVESEPPAERVEVIPVTPGPGHVWIKGHWVRKHRAWAWQPGHWEVVRASHEWVPGHWRRHADGRWFWVEGHWRRY